MFLTDLRSKTVVAAQVGLHIASKFYTLLFKYRGEFLLGIFYMASDPSHKPGRCSPKYPEWAGCAVGCEPSNNKLARQIYFQLFSRRGPYNFLRLPQSSPCTRACPRCSQNEILDSHMLNPAMCAKWGRGCPNPHSGEILGMLLCKENSTEAFKNYMVPFY